MEKAEYFPRQKFFEDVQELVATFYPKGDFLTENSLFYSSKLWNEGVKDDFYFPLLMLSMLSGTNHIISLSSSIVKNIKNTRIHRKNTSFKEFKGEIDVEEYIKRNHVEKAIPKVYPSTISISTFQIPEYQLTLCILKHCETIFQHLFHELGPEREVNMFEKAYRNCERLQRYSTLMQKKYGVHYGSRETYSSLKRKVMYRYRNHKLLCHTFHDLMNCYESILGLKGINLDSKEALEILSHSEKFDDRLFEIWLIKKSAELIAEKVSIPREKIEYSPLYQARENNTYAALIKLRNYRIEILFQNRKNFMPKDKLKWYYNENGKDKKLGAIPDLVFLKYDGGANPAKIVLADAKNRTWSFSGNTQNIKDEVVQQIYIQDNFRDIFDKEFHSILVAHNTEAYQSRKYKHKDHPEYEIDVISLDFTEGNLLASIERYGQDLCAYLGVTHE